MILDMMHCHPCVEDAIQYEPCPAFLPLQFRTRQQQTIIGVTGEAMLLGRGIASSIVQFPEL